MPLRVWTPRLKTGTQMVGCRQIGRNEINDLEAGAASPFLGTISWLSR